MFDMRYHIASLVAVFLALTVGLLLGSLFVDKGLLANQQEKLLDSIRADVNAVNEKNLKLESEVATLRAFEKQVLPVAVKNRLAETSVTIVTLVEGQQGQVDDLRKVLSQAGAASFHLHIKMKEIDISSDDLKERFQTVLGNGETAGREAEKLFWARLTGEMVGLRTPELMGVLFEDGLMQADSTAAAASNVIILAPDDRDLGSRDTLFVNSLAATDGVRVITTETSEVKLSRIAAYKLYNVSTIDNVDTIPGKLSLIYLLAAPDVTGHFGIKAAADKPMP